VFHHRLFVVRASVQASMSMVFGPPVPGRTEKAASTLEVLASALVVDLSLVDLERLQAAKR
jgi:hypothetical protein